MAENLPETRENLVALITHATKGPGKYITQKQIWEDSKLKPIYSLPEFNKRLNSKGGNAFGVEDSECLWLYANKELIVSIEWLAEKLKYEGTQTHIERSIAACDELSVPLNRFYATHAEQIARLAKDGIQSYYCSYKYSYRWHKRMIRSAAVILNSARLPAIHFTFVERQVNQHFYQREDTVGVVFSKTKNIWIQGQEIEHEQPRIFSLTRREYGYDSRDEMDSPQASSAGRLQVFCGFILENYAKFPNDNNARFGGFSSPFALQRVPERAFQELNLKESELFLPENVDQILTFLSGTCGNISEEEFLKDESINDIVKSHMRHYQWSDSNMSSSK